MQVGFYFNCLGQVCSTVPDTRCGNLPIVASICGAQIFCIGDSVGMMDQTPINVDSSYICWGDGIINRYAGNFSGCKRHKYNFPPDSCIGGNGIINLDIILSVAKNCLGNRSFAAALDVEII